MYFFYKSGQKRGMPHVFSTYPPMRPLQRHRERQFPPAEGADFFYPGDALQFLLDRQHISRAAFSAKLGYCPNYFQDNIFNTCCNDGTHELPKPLQ